MYHQIVSTLPKRQPKRERIFAMRLTDAERAQIQELAKRLKLPDSFMAQHFILEAVAYYTLEHTEETEVEV